MWAQQTDSPHARAYAADVAVRAYVANNQPDKCREALDHEREALRAIDPARPVSSWWYFYDESFYWGTKSECSLKLREPDAAWEAAEKSLGLIDATHVHNYALTLTFQSEARIQQGDASGASRIIGDVAQLTAANSSRRIDERITGLRRALGGFGRIKAVRELDERLMLYRGPAAGRGNTNRS